MLQDSVFNGALSVKHQRKKKHIFTSNSAKWQQRSTPLIDTLLLEFKFNENREGCLCRATFSRFRWCAQLVWRVWLI